MPLGRFVAPQTGWDSWENTNTNTNTQTKINTKPTYMYIPVWAVFQSALLLSSCLLLPPPSHDRIVAIKIQTSTIEGFFQNKTKTLVLPHFQSFFTTSLSTHFSKPFISHNCNFIFSHVFKPFWALRRIYQSSDHLRPLLKMKPFWNLNTGINTWRPQEDLHHD